MTGQIAPMSPKQAAALLRVTPLAHQAELTALPDSLLIWHPAPGEWCTKEVVGRLIEAEQRGFAGRIRVI